MRLQRDFSLLDILILCDCDIFVLYDMWAHRVNIIPNRTANKSIIPLIPERMFTVTHGPWIVLSPKSNNVALC